MDNFDIVWKRIYCSIRWSKTSTATSKRNCPVVSHSLFCAISLAYEYAALRIASYCIM